MGVLSGNKKALGLLTWGFFCWDRMGTDLFKSGTDVWGRERIDGRVEWGYLTSVFQAPDALHRARTTLLRMRPTRLHG